MGVDITKDKYRGFCLKSGLIIFFVVFLIIICILSINSQFLDQSFFALSVAVAAFSASLLVVIAGIYKQTRLEKTAYNKLWPFFAIVLGITFGFIAVILSNIFIFLISNTFADIVYSPIGISVLIAIFCGLLAYLVTKSVFRLNQRKHLLIVSATFVIGFLTASTLAFDRYWWRSSICALGMPLNKNPEYYNFMLILVGALLILFAVYLRPQIRLLLDKGLLDKKKARILTVLYFIEMITVILVGAIPYGISHWLNIIHVFFGFYVFINIGAIMLFSFWLFRKFPRNFIIINYLLLLSGYIFYFFGSNMPLLPYAVTEMLITVTVVIWIFLFLRTLKILNKSG